MRPRISILMVLAITTYVAVAIMGLIHPETWWSNVTFYGWLLILVVLLTLGLNSERPRSIFMLTMFMTAITYAVGSILALGYSTPHLFRDHVDEIQSRSTIWMPHHVFLQLNVWLEEMEIANEFDMWDASSDILLRSAIAHTSLILGLLAGYVSLWIYCRRHQNCSSDAHLEH